MGLRGVVKHVSNEEGDKENEKVEGSIEGTLAEMEEM